MANSLTMGVYSVGTAMSDRWVSVEEIAEYLGVSRDTVYAWEKGHAGPQGREVLEVQGR